jgi:uncharacterized membrane protein
MKKKMTAVNYIGLVLIILSILLFIIMYNFSKATLELIDSEHGGSCMTYETCPHVAVLNQAYLGYILSAAIFIIGLFLVFFGEKPEKAEANENEKKNKLDESLKTLTGDEKTVYEKIMASGGVIFQSDLVEKSGFPKAKVSRILDRMEAGGLVERKRRGMANAIVLK